MKYMLLILIDFIKENVIDAIRIYNTKRIVSKRLNLKKMDDSRWLINAKKQTWTQKELNELNELRVQDRAASLD